jgi:hypothetical protein
MFDAEVAEVDAFLAEYKTLTGFPPEWTQQFGRDWQVRWGIENSIGVQVGELCLGLNEKFERPSVSALYQRRLIYRLDVVPAEECKPNDFGARAYDLPPWVCGPHTHPWPENKEYVRLKGFGTLPFRKPIEGTAVTIDHAIAIAASDLGIDVRGDQRECPLPRQPSLFPGNKS